MSIEACFFSPHYELHAKACQSTRAFVVTLLGQRRGRHVPLLRQGATRKQRQIEKRVRIGHGQGLMWDERLGATQYACDWGKTWYSKWLISNQGISFICMNTGRNSQRMTLRIQPAVWHCNTEHSRAMKASYKHQFIAFKAFYFACCQRVFFVFFLNVKYSPVSSRVQ